MTKVELLANIRRDGARFAELVAEMDDRHLTDPVLDDGWSVKDVIAHITAWSDLCVGWVQSGVRSEGPFDDASINAFNRRLYEQHRDDTLDDVYAASQAAFDAMQDVVEHLDPDAIDAPPPWAREAAGPSLGQVISANSDEHYREHIEQIERWMESQRE